MIAKGVLNEGDQPNVLMPSFDNARKLVQKELENECVCPNSCYGQFFLRIECTQFNCKWLS